MRRPVVAICDMPLGENQSLAGVAEYFFRSAD
jgi:hypothetical protein